MVRWLHRKKQKAYKRPISHTWKRNRRSWRYSANMSSMRTICEKIRTRWPVSFNLHSSLSSRNSFPLPRIRVCWKRITRRSHQGYESARATVFPVTCTYRTIILSNNIHNYKIAKIARTLWLAERRVCMRVCKHGCDIKMFCFSRTNQVSTNLKKFLSSKFDKVTLFTHSFVGWNLEKSLQTSCVDFFAQKLTF